MDSHLESMSQDQLIAEVRKFRFGIRARLKSSGISRHRLVASIAAACIAASVHAAEIRVISAAPLSGVLDELGAQFEREAGHRIVRKFVSGPLVKREVETGEAYDVAISVTPVIDDLAKAGRIDASTQVSVAYSGLGVGVRAGAHRPDIGSVEAFKRALLAAGSVTYDKDGAAGKYFVELLQRLGIAEPMQAKLRPRSLDNLYDAVPR